MWLLRLFHPTSQLAICQPPNALAHCAPCSGGRVRSTHVHIYIPCVCYEAATALWLSIYLLLCPSPCPWGCLPLLHTVLNPRAARARIDRAEAQGRRRDEQLEMLHAVRQYMAQTKAHAKALQAQC